MHSRLYCFHCIKRITKNITEDGQQIGEYNGEWKCDNNNNIKKQSRCTNMGGNNIDKKKNTKQCVLYNKVII